MSLPKRCKDCRQNNKEVASDNKKLVSKILLLVALILLALVFNNINRVDNDSQVPDGEFVVTDNISGSGADIGNTDEEYVGTDTTENDDSSAEIIEAKNEDDNIDTGVSDTDTDVNDTDTDTASVVHQTKGFRNKDRLNDHYEKHGRDMGFASAKEYENAAKAVVENPDALHKLEAEDGDDVYYIEATNDFVVVAKDGYIRTYFRPDSGIKYYNKQ